MYVVLLFSRRLVHRKTSQKSLEKGFGGRTFPQKGFPPIITHKMLYQRHYNSELFILLPVPDIPCGIRWESFPVRS